jgi:hypothetical protein
VKKSKNSKIEGKPQIKGGVISEPYSLHIRITFAKFQPKNLYSYEFLYNTLKKGRIK